MRTVLGKLPGSRIRRSSRCRPSAPAPRRDVHQQRLGRSSSKTSTIPRRCHLPRPRPSPCRRPAQRRQDGRLQPVGRRKTRRRHFGGVGRVAPVVIGGNDGLARKSCIEGLAIAPATPNAVSDGPRALMSTFLAPNRRSRSRRSSRCRRLHLATRGRLPRRPFMPGNTKIPRRAYAGRAGNRNTRR